MWRSGTRGTGVDGPTRTLRQQDLRTNGNDLRRKNMRNVWTKFAIVLVAMMALGAGAIADPPAGAYQVDLMAGQYTDVGTVYVWDDGTNITVAVEVDEPGWRITAVHFDVEEDAADVPQTKQGNPKIGQFDYVKRFDPPVTYDEWATALPAGCAVVMAHADVCYDPMTALEDALPPTATVKVAYPYAGAPSYFQTTVTSAGVLNGTFDGWCVDTDNVIYQNTNYTVNVYSSYEDLPTGLIEHPENLDVVNWILNQGFVGTAAYDNLAPDAGNNGLGESLGTYTYGDVQRAIWTLIEDANSTSGLGSWSQDRVNEILAAASAPGGGEGFVPGCGDVIAVILQPVTGGATSAQITIAQVTLAEVGLECEAACETAWPDVNDLGVADFGGDSWATCIDYCPSE